FVNGHSSDLLKLLATRGGIRCGHDDIKTFFGGVGRRKNVEALWCAKHPAAFEIVSTVAIELCPHHVDRAFTLKRQRRGFRGNVRHLKVARERKALKQPEHSLVRCLFGIDQESILAMNDTHGCQQTALDGRKRRRYPRMDCEVL